MNDAWLKYPGATGESTSTRARTRPDGAPERVAPLDEHWESVIDILGRFDLLTLDVFDTCLTRRCGAPKALYLMLGRRLHREGVIDCSPEVFARARARAEEVVWRQVGGMDGPACVQAFQEEVARMLLLPRDLVPLLVDAELDLESRLLIPVPDTKHLINAAVARGVRVGFITDTYFHEPFVRNLLERHGLWPDGAFCMASTDLRASKLTGRLFDVLLETENLQPDRVLHVGDNLHSDCAVPRSRGVSARLLPAALLNRFESRLSEARWESAGLSSAIAGASRAARLLGKPMTDEEQAVRDVAAGVAAPILIGYVLWLLHRARQEGVQRLYFLARDGQILAKIALALTQRLNWSFDVRYLFVSRRTTNLAATSAPTDEELGWIFRDRETLSPRAMFAGMNIAWKELPASFIGELEFSGSNPDSAPTSSAGVAIIRSFLSGDAGSALLADRSASSRRIVNDYLRQELVLDDARCALIDLGGVGSQMRALHTLVTGEGAPAPMMFLVGIDSPKAAGLQPGDADPAWLRSTECYLYDYRRGRGIPNLRGFGTCVQMFCAADHGTTTGLERNGQRVEPMLESERDEAVIRWGLPLVQSTVESVVENLLVDEDLIDPASDVRQVACAVIQEFWTNPTYHEALAWGRFPFEGAQSTNAETRPLAWRYSARGVVKDTIAGRFPDFGWQHWFEGSVRQSSQPLRMVLSGLKRAYYRIDRSPRGAALVVKRWIRKGLRRA